MNLGQRIKAAIGLIAKGSIAPFDKIINVSGTGQEKLSSETPTAQSVWVSRAIKLVTGPIASAQLKFYSDKRAGDTEVRNPKVEAFWQKPARGLSFYDFIEATVLWAKLRGEFFWLLGDSVPFPEVSDAPFQQLIVARPDRMREIIDMGELVGWEFRDGQNKAHLLLPENVIHSKTYNPCNEWRGLGELDAAMTAAEADYLAGKFGLNLMRNNGDRGPIISVKSGLPSDQQRQQIVNQLMEKKEQASRGVFKAAFVTADVKVEDPQLQSVDQAFLEMRKASRQEVFSAFGVPPSMADAVASYSVGSASDWFRLIIDTCQPMGCKIAEQVEEVCRRLMKVQLFASFNFDDHPTMRQVRMERAQTAQIYWNMGVPLKVLNENLGLGLREFEGWDIGYLPFSVAPVGSEMEQGAEPNYSETPNSSDDQESDPETDPLADAKAAIRSKLAGTQFKGGDKKRQQWNAYMVARRGTEKAYEAAFRKVLFAARQETLRKIESIIPEAPGKGLCSHAKASPASLLFDQLQFQGSLVLAMRKASRKAFQVAGDNLFQSIGLEDPWAMPETETIRYMQQRDPKWKGVSERVAERVRGIIEEGLAAGDSRDQMVSQVRDEFNAIGKRQATVIAQTETTAAFNFGRQHAMQKAGTPQKEWVNSRGPNVRPTHQAADGQIVDVDEPFIVGGQELMFPGDSSRGAGPEETVNCYCVSAPVGGEGEAEEAELES